MAKAQAYFGPKLFKFLKDLAANNDRDWFKANKDRYEEVVKLPLLTFIADIAGLFGTVVLAVGMLEIPFPLVVERFLEG